MPSTEPGTVAKIALVVVASTIAAVLVAANSIVTQNGNNGLTIPYNVTVTLTGRNITVYVGLPGPTIGYQQYCYGYQCYSYQMQQVAVRVIVVLEKLIPSGAGYTPQLVQLEAPLLKAYGSPHNATVVFKGLEPGHYRVSVYFWNEFLSILYTKSGAWKPLASKYVWEGDVR